MEQPGLDKRYRDKNGEISKKSFQLGLSRHGHALRRREFVGYPSILQWH
jgi:hypothetical protein